MTKYICTECTGRTGEEHTFVLSREPEYCPWCGQSTHIQVIEEYLREQLSDAEWEVNHWQEKYYEVKDE